MTPVFPYQIRRAADGWRGELLLRLKNGRSAYVVQLSLEQARVLAVEMRGLATDQCPQHHLTLQVANALGGKVSHVVLKAIDHSGGVTGSMRLVTPGGLCDVTVDTAAALAMAVHLGLPIFMDGDFAVSHGTVRAIEGSDESPESLEIPEAIQDVIEHLDLRGFHDETNA